MPIRSPITRINCRISLQFCMVVHLSRFYRRVHICKVPDTHSLQKPASKIGRRLEVARRHEKLASESGVEFRLMAPISGAGFWGVYRYGSSQICAPVGRSSTVSLTIVISAGWPDRAAVYACVWCVYCSFIRANSAAAQTTQKQVLLSRVFVSFLGDCMAVFLIRFLQPFQTVSTAVSPLLLCQMRAALLLWTVCLSSHVNISFFVYRASCEIFHLPRSGVILYIIISVVSVCLSVCPSVRR